MSRMDQHAPSPQASSAEPSETTDRAAPGTAPAPGITRRTFLAGTAAVAGVAGLSALGTAACATPYGPYPSPSRFITLSTAGLEVGVPAFVEFELTPAAPSVPEASPPLGSMPPGRGGAWLVKQEDGTVVAFVPFCTHSACVYAWKPDQSHFVCPCHPGIFDIDGTVVSGPPPGPLWRFETRQTGADTIEVGWADPKA
jgi:menaquinol-cytochrome c reductase iron-sulfur subunit